MFDMRYLIKQLAHYLHDAQHESYLVNLPAKALVGAASGDFTDGEQLLQDSCGQWERAT